MALSPPSQFSGYAPGSIAGRPARKVGGMRGKNEDPQAFRGRMDAAYASNPPQTGTADGGQTRQDRVIASRMDGSFDTKRNAFNAGNTNVQMDEAGNIVPRSATPPVSAGTPPAGPASPSPSPPVSKSPSSSSMAPALTAGIAGGPVAAGMAQVAGKALAMPPRKPATFEGMSMEQFKTGRTIERPTTSANPTARRSPGGGFVMPPSVTASVTPPVTRNAPVTPRAVTPMSPTENQQFTALGQAMQLSQATQGPMPRPYASTPAPPTASTAPPGGFSPDFHRRFAPATPAAPPPSPAVAAPAPPTAVAPPRRLDAAQAQAVKNPQGLSARLNPPGLPPKTLSQDPIAKPFVAAAKAIKGGIQSQAAKNPQGIAARLGRLTGVVPPSAMLGR